MGHFGAQAARPARNLAGRAGRPSFSSDLSERIDYNIPDLPIYARRDALSSFPDYRCPCHWHRDLEFIHVISGQMQYFVNGAIVTLEAGNGLVVNSNRLHYGFSPQQRQCWFTCVVVDLELLERLGADERVFVGELLHQRVPTAARRHSARLA